MKEIISKIVNDLDSGMEKGHRIFFGNPDYDGLELDSHNFHTIKEGKEKSKKIAFIDGGNQEIIGGANFSLQMQRIFVCVLEKGKQARNIVYEYYLYIKTAKKDDSIIYETDVFYLNEKTKKIGMETLYFDPFDPMLKNGPFRAEAVTIGGNFRRIAELKAAADAAEMLSEGDLIVLDGTLQSVINAEEEKVQQLIEKCSEKNVFVCALSKTNSFVTEKGGSVPYILDKMAPQESWYYYPAFESKNEREIAFVKLHEKSKFIFRFEFLKKDRDRIKEILPEIADNSGDPVFLGYPYGLIKADRFARISNREAERERTRLMALAGKDWKKIEIALGSKSAHDVLDRIG